MNAMLEPVERYRALIAAAAPSLPGRHSGWLSAQRSAAAEHFARHGFPTRKHEAWRYTGLERLLEQSWALQAMPEALSFDATAVARHHLAENAVARLVFINGHWLSAFSSVVDVPAGLQIGSLRRALEQYPEQLAPWLGKAAGTAVSSFTALNTALIDDGAWIHIAAGTHLSGPVELLYLTTGEEAAVVHPRNLVVLEEGAEATVVEHYASLDETACFTNGLTEVLLDRRACLEHVRLQDENPAARHISNVFVAQGEASHYRGVGVSLGGLWVRNEYHNQMRQSQARCELDGLYVAGDRQLNDVHLDIGHSVPACSSRERFKGILLGRGRAVFDGRIRVDVDAQKTDAQLANDNLLLSRDAEVDTKPQLEIFADDVKCSHGTTVGQLEPAQLFYLRSRGIAADDARRMLCLGFAAEVLENCSVDAFRVRVEQRLQQRLADVNANASGVE
jgi:Fe-S cluster assembly protein SufD